MKASASARTRRPGSSAVSTGVKPPATRMPHVPARGIASRGELEALLSVGEAPAALRARFLIIARDPRIVPAMHHHCDEWCDYCPATGRCVAYKCRDAFRKAPNGDLCVPPGEACGAAIELVAA